MGTCEQVKACFSARTDVRGRWWPCRLPFVTELPDKGLAARLPANVRFGTSSWNYPGWKGLVYRRSYSSKKDFEARCLEEYGEYPWFRAVGLDSTFYGPPRNSTLDRYASQLSDHIQWVSKVWERITIPRFARHRRYGDLAGKTNTDYLNPSLFREAFLAATPADDRQHRRMIGNAGRYSREDRPLRVPVSKTGTQSEGHRSVHREAGCVLVGPAPGLPLRNGSSHEATALR